MNRQLERDRFPAPRWRQAGLLAGVALLTTLTALAACAACAPAAGGSAHSTATSATGATPSASPAVRVAWRAIATPPHFSPPDPRAATTGSEVDVEPTDGATAYTCTIADPTNASPPQPYVTHDAGASWQPLSVPASLQPAYGCVVGLDRLDPSLLDLAAVTTQTARSSAGYSLRSEDGGATWAPATSSLPEDIAPPPSIVDDATLRGATYALFQAQIDPDLRRHLAVSVDQFHTWRDLDAAIIGAGQQPQQFWINPASGALLVMAVPSGSTSGHLWSSNDQGQHWTALTTPDAAPDFVVQAMSQSGPWHICALALTGPTTITCSRDGGATWTQAPPLPSSINPLLIALAGDGALLLRTDDPAGKPALWRLPAGAASWQSLGLAPQSFVEYASGPSGGTLWAAPLNGVVTDTQGATYSAPYPA